MRLVVTMTLVTAVACWGPKTGLGWQQGATPPWPAHTGSICTTLSNGTVILLGGQRGDHGGGQFEAANCTNQVYSFEVEEDTWINHTEVVPWTKRWGHSAVTTPDDMVWMFFGCCEPDSPRIMLNDVWTWNPVLGGPWKQMDTKHPFEGLEATSAALRNGDEIWIVGGWSSSRGTLSQVEYLSTTTLQWTVKSDTHKAPWQTRANHATAISPDNEWLFVFGGQHRDWKTGRWTRIGDTWRVRLSDYSLSAWQEINGLEPGRASPTAIYLPNGWLITTGGHYVPEHAMDSAEEDYVKNMHDDMHKQTLWFNDVWALDMSTGGRSGFKLVEKEAPWIGRDDQASCESGGSILVFGGGRKYGGGDYLNDAWRLPNAASVYHLGAGRRDEM